MSTITVVRKDGVAAIAADTLTKFGGAKESATYVVNHQKILTVQENFLAVTGPSAGKLILQDFFARRRKAPRLGTVAEIFKTWMELHEVLKGRYFLRPEEDESDEFESSRLDVLILNASGIFGVDAFRTVQEFARFYAYGNGSCYALGAMYARYEDPKLDAEALARLGVSAAAEFDDSSGLPVISHRVELASA